MNVIGHQSSSVASERPEVPGEVDADCLAALGDAAGTWLAALKERTLASKISVFPSSLNLEAMPFCQRQLPLPLGGAPRPFFPLQVFHLHWFSLKELGSLVLIQGT